MFSRIAIRAATIMIITLIELQRMSQKLIKEWRLINPLPTFLSFTLLVVNVSFNQTLLIFFFYVRQT